MKNLTDKTPNPEKAVSAAFDSVNLINKLVLETADDKKKANVDRNVKHLEVMLTKEFFTEALTQTQKDEVDACLLAGKAYIG
jgi:hypothetical protein